MAFAQGDEIKLKFLSEENIIFLETVFWTFDCNFNALLSGRSYKTDKYPLKYISDALFFLEAETKSESSITIHFRRYTVFEVKPPDSGYYINVSMSMVGCSSPPVEKHMEWDIRDVSVTYNLSSLNKELTDRGRFTIKCTTKMVEMMSLINQNRTDQEKLLKEYVRSSSEGSVTHMASLLEREELRDLFSGRQQYGFAFSTTVLILRSLKYAEEIVTLQRMRQEGKRDRSWRLPLILGFIQHGEVRKISKFDCLWLYMVAHGQGLVFLQTECSEFMLSNFDNEYVIQCLLVATTADDNYLLDKALDYFLSNRAEIIASPAWELTKVKYWQSVLCITSAMSRKISNGVEQVSG